MQGPFVGEEVGYSLRGLPVPSGPLHCPPTIQPPPSVPPTACLPPHLQASARAGPFPGSIGLSVPLGDSCCVFCLNLDVTGKFSLVS